MTEDANQSKALANKPSGGLNNSIRFVLIAASVIAAIPTVMNLALAINEWVPVSELQKGYQREKIYTRNFGSLPKRTDPIQIAADKSVELGAYNSGDVYVRILNASTGEQLFMEWLGREQMLSKPEGYSLWDIVFSAAKADEKKPIRLTQKLNYKVKCMWKPVKGKATQIVEVNGKCFKERFSPFTGKTDPREELKSCAKVCDGADVKYDKG